MPPHLAIGAGGVWVEEGQTLPSEAAVRAMLLGMLLLMCLGDTPCPALYSCSSPDTASGHRPLLVGGHRLGVNTLDSALTLPTRELRVSPQSRAQLDLRHLQGGWWGQTRLKQEKHHGWVHPQGRSIREQGNKGVPHPQLEQ